MNLCHVELISKSRELISHEINVLITDVYSHVYDIYMYIYKKFHLHSGTSDISEPKELLFFCYIHIIYVIRYNFLNVIILSLNRKI